MSEDISEYVLEDFEGFSPIYSRCPETGLRVCEILKNVLVREDGKIKSLSKASRAKKYWNNGTDSQSGRFYTRIEGKHYDVHRLVGIAFIKNDGVGNLIDHINGDVEDNRIENLRWVTIRQNNSNKKIHREGKLIGVWVDNNSKRKKKFASAIRINKIKKTLGYFHTEQEAHEAYVKALKELGESLPTLPEHSKKPSP